MSVTNAISSESRPVVCAPEPLPQSLAHVIQVSPALHVRSPQTGPPLLLELLLLELLELLLLLLDELLLDELLLDELLEDEDELLLEDELELLDISPLLLPMVLPLLLDELEPLPPLPLDT